LNNYKLLIQYEGTNYAGWQIQSNAVTIQQKITIAIETILKHKVILNGSGRTDSGVHAIGQVANFRTESELNLYKFKFQLNSILPDDISVLSAELTNPEFHARYDAKKRAYLYLFTRTKSPFLKNYSWHFKNDADLDKLRITSKTLLGKKDFSAFCRAASETLNRECEVYNVTLRERNGIVIFFIEADRFLHGMVRTIIGTLLDSVMQQKPEEYIQNILQQKQRSAAGEAVPAKGLFLYKVKY